ncbi:MAG TPA: ferritin-like domain-containing protein [Burkholderiales bacterium]|jgi:uncharacterized ferritin-like protein (DUF455 family)|nr:ferritin-like domain-containing protein [Burkholderiales bacterium]
MRQTAYRALLEPDPPRKVELTRAAFALRDAPLDDLAQAYAAQEPGRPARPALVHAARVPSRGLGSAHGRAALIHAIAHIEFNAINLALDAVCRFPGLPEEYYRDWISVAAEEALHHSLLVAHLQGLGHAYGDFDAHNGLWEMAEKTRDDVVGRMGLVPRILEARGLDVTPAIQAKLLRHGESRAAEILDIILRDEVGHVAIGNRWYGWLCAQHGLDPVAEFTALSRRYNAPKVRPPFNREGRLRGGFTAAELDAWEREALAQSREQP